MSDDSTGGAAGGCTTAVQYMTPYTILFRTLKGKGSSFDIAPPTVLDSGAL